MITRTGSWDTERRSDRDDHVTILHENIRPGFEANFAILPTILTCGCYDCSSAMHSFPTHWSVNGLPTIVSKDPTSCIIERNATSPLSINDINCIQNMYFGYDNSCKSLSPTLPTPPTISPTLNPTFIPTTQRPTPNTLDFCLYGDHGSLVPSPTPSTLGFYNMGHYTVNGTYNGREYYVQHRTSYTHDTQYPRIIYWTGNLWRISLSVGGVSYGFCTINVDHPRDCGNSWGRTSSIYTKLNTKWGECDIVRCQTIDVFTTYYSSYCYGKFNYVSDNVYENKELGRYWAYNDFRGQWLCGNSIAGITDNGFTGVFHLSDAATFPVLYDGVYYSVTGDENDVIVMHCNGCNGTNTQCSYPTISPSITPTLTPVRSPTIIPSIMPTFIPSSSPTESPMNGNTEEPTITPTQIPSNAPTKTGLITDEPSMNPTINPTETPTNINITINPTNTKTDTLSPSKASDLESNPAKPLSIDTKTIILIIIAVIALCIVTILVYVVSKKYYKSNKKSNDNLKKEKSDSLKPNERVNRPKFTNIESESQSNISVKPKCKYGTLPQQPQLKSINEMNTPANDDDDSSENVDIAKPTNFQYNSRATLSNDTDINGEGFGEAVELLDIDLSKKEAAFKAYYNRVFDGVLLVYYDTLVYNRVNDIDMLILLDNIDDLNQYNIIKNKFHQIKFINIVKQIKIERNKWIKCLKKLNIYIEYINVFDKHGIYTINDFKKRFKNVDELNSLLNNIDTSKKAYNILSKK